MKIMLLITLLFPSLLSFAQREIIHEEELVESPVFLQEDSLRIEGEAIIPYYLLEQEPAFPGGYNEMGKWVENNMQLNMQEAIEGKCYLKLSVLSSGKIAQSVILRGVPDCPLCDKEAIRLVKSMPPWTPGKYKGKAVATEVNIPIRFKR